MSQQLSEAERKAAWETYYRQQALLQQQQYGIPTANYLATTAARHQPSTVSK